MVGITPPHEAIFIPRRKRLENGVPGVSPWRGQSPPTALEMGPKSWRLLPGPGAAGIGNIAVAINVVIAAPGCYAFTDVIALL